MVGREEPGASARGHSQGPQLQGVLEDRMVVEKDTKLVFVIGEGDVNQVSNCRHLQQHLSQDRVRWGVVW